jgi:hypothetical protein
MPTPNGGNSNLWGTTPKERVYTSPAGLQRPKHMFSTIATDNASRGTKIASKHRPYRNEWEVQQDHLAQRLSDIDKRLEYLDNKDHF